MPKDISWNLQSQFRKNICENVHFEQSPNYHRYLFASFNQEFQKTSILRNRLQWLSQISIIILWKRFQKKLQDVFCEKSFLRKLCLIKLAIWTSLRPATLLKKRIRHRCFPVDCATFLRTPFFIEHLWWLLLLLLKSCKKSTKKFY